MADQADYTRAALLETLMQKVESEQFPSPTMLDTIESLLTAREKDHYVEMLLDGIASTQFPSISMINRVRGLL